MMAHWQNADSTSAAGNRPVLPSQSASGRPKELKPAMNTETGTALSAIILAGGQASRMGGQDKGLILLNGRPMIDYVITRLKAQVDDMVISANRHHADYARFGWPVFADHATDYAGPLAGIAACLPHCRHDWVLVVACDSPLLPTDLAAQLFSRRQRDTQVVMVHDGERLQPLFLLLHKSLGPALDQALQRGEYKVERWARAQPHIIVTQNTPQAFMNINTEAERLALESLLQQ